MTKIRRARKIGNGHRRRPIQMESLLLLMGGKANTEGRKFGH
jgi:hypothetical protein